MSNYVRAVFCFEHRVEQEEFYELLIALHRLNCRYNYWTLGSVSAWLSRSNEQVEVSEQVLDRDLNRDRLEQVAAWLAVPGHLNVELAWLVDGDVFAAGITQHTWEEGDSKRRLDLAVEDTPFFSIPRFGDRREEKTAFESLKKLIVEVIRHIEPTVGAIDYEVDLLCDEVQRTPLYALPFWGTFLSRRQMARWSKEDIATLHATVDEYIPVDNLGTLFFIDPLMPDEAQTSRHLKVRELIDRNMMHDGETGMEGS